MEVADVESPDLEQEPVGKSDFIIVTVILSLWAFVVFLFFQRWGEKKGNNKFSLTSSGKIRSLLPYQPVYSKEMAAKLEKLETGKNNRGSFSLYNFQPEYNQRVSCF